MVHLRFFSVGSPNRFTFMITQPSILSKKTPLVLQSVWDPLLVASHHFATCSAGILFHMVHLNWRTTVAKKIDLTVQPTTYSATYSSKVFSYINQNHAASQLTLQDNTTS